jgi:hypothetical protein
VSLVVGEVKLTERQWDLINYAEEFWHEFKAFPSYRDIKENVEGFTTEEEIENELYSPAVHIRLVNRGIDYSKPITETKHNPSRLSDKQLAVINTVLNVADKRSLQQKLKDLNVSTATYYGWKKQPRFAKYLRDRSEELFGDNMPEVHKSLADRAVSGDTRAIKLFYEVSGRHTGIDKTEVANMRLLIVRLIEVLQRHLDDDTMRAVAREIGALTGPIIPGAAPVAGEIINGSYTETSAI